MRMTRSLLGEATTSRRTSNWRARARDVEAELDREIKALVEYAEKLESKTMLSGETDLLNAIVVVHPGAGGTESQDWAEMLMRMYLRWAERQGFKVEINEIQDGDEAGIKSATFTISGEFAFGLLSGETGVHRLVRISPFDSAKRRHTVCERVCLAGDRRHDRDRHQAGGSADRHVPLGRQGRAACEYDGLGGAHHASADGAGGGLPERALAAQEQRARDEDAAFAAVRV